MVIERAYECIFKKYYDFYFMIYNLSENLKISFPRGGPKIYILYSENQTFNFSNLNPIKRKLISSFSSS